MYKDLILIIESVPLANFILYDVTTQFLISRIIKKNRSVYYLSKEF